ncbi:peptidylprolyl isomerase [Tahibacter amnicola]|uniref:peptidylprolyl isomerase n=1 Tax=Tahibacter amnicola TaxID=2976241 RepID=A0ABY6BPL8_9GAMM|nr:peptidylprolyl isomerase [Tahibacter amnicola]UXI70496.1 peptidylprolyl isomerase [Tahibacter amnicola]
MNRSIPIVMDRGALSDAAAADAGDRSLPGQAPGFLRVGDTIISEADVAREMQYHRADDPHASRRAAARALAVREVLRLEAVRLGLDAQVQPREGEPREEATIQWLIDHEVPSPRADEASCRHYFAMNRERLRHPDRLQVRHILLAAAPGDTAARWRACQLGESLIEALRQEPDRFGEFALRHSACPSREAGGELGWLGRGDTVPEFDRQLFMLTPGLAGLTVETRYGHHVVLLDSVERGEPASYEEVADKVAAYLETQARQNAINGYLQILFARYGVEGVDPEEAAP